MPICLRIMFLCDACGESLEVEPEVIPKVLEGVAIDLSEHHWDNDEQGRIFCPKCAPIAAGPRYDA